MLWLTEPTVKQPRLRRRVGLDAPLHVPWPKFILACIIEVCALGGDTSLPVEQTDVDHFSVQCLLSTESTATCCGAITPGGYVSIQFSCTDYWIHLFPDAVEYFGWTGRLIAL